MTQWTPMNWGLRPSLKTPGRGALLADVLKSTVNVHHCVFKTFVSGFTVPRGPDACPAYTAGTS